MKRRCGSDEAVAHPPRSDRVEHPQARPGSGRHRPDRPRPYTGQGSRRRSLGFLHRCRLFERSHPGGRHGSADCRGARSRCHQRSGLPRDRPRRVDGTRGRRDPASLAGSLGRGTSLQRATGRGISRAGERAGSGRHSAGCRETSHGNCRASESWRDDPLGGGRGLGLRRFPVGAAPGGLQRGSGVARGLSGRRRSQSEVH